MDIAIVNKEMVISFLKKNRIENIFIELALYDFHSIHFLGIHSTDGQLKGILILQKNKRLKLFTQISAPTNFPSCNLIYPLTTSNPAKRNGEIKKVMSAIAAFLKKSKKIISVPFPTTWDDFQPFYWEGFKVITRYTYTIDLIKSIDNVYADFSPERKKNITQAKKQNIFIKPDKKDALKTLSNNPLYKQNKKWVDNFIHNFCNDSNSIIKVAYRDNKPIASVICIYDPSVCYYLFGGYDINAKHQGAGALCMWEAIQQAKNKKISTFDFEGSMIPEVERYFRNFGGELTPFYHVNRAPYLLELILKLRYKSFF